MKKFVLLLMMLLICTACTQTEPEEAVDMDEILQIKAWLLDEELEGTGWWGYIDPLTREFPHRPDGDGYWIPDDGVSAVANEDVFVYEVLEVGKPRIMAPMGFSMAMGKGNEGGPFVSIPNLEIDIEYEGIVEVSKVEPTDTSIVLVDRSVESWSRFDTKTITAPCTVNVLPIGKELAAEGAHGLLSHSDTLAGKEYTIRIRATTLNGAPVVTAVVKLTTIPDPEYPWEEKFDQGWGEIHRYGEERTRFCSIELVSYTYNEMHIMNGEAGPE